MRHPIQKQISLILAAVCVLSAVSVGAYANGVAVFSSAAADASADSTDAEATCTGEVTDDTENEYGMSDYVVEIICTIPEDCSDSSIELTAVGAALSGALDDYGLSVCPGDRIELQLRVVNESNTDYAYEEGSFYISTVDWSDYEDYTQSADGAAGFDGQTIPDELTACRTANAALSALYGETDADYTYADGLASDDRLDTLLTAAGYADGIGALDDYYIDYYNAQNGTDCASLSELPASYLQELTGGTIAVSSGTDSTKNKIQESGAALNALYYDWFYNACVSLSADLYDLRSSTPDTEHSIGSHMEAQADGTPLVEDAVSGALGTIAAGGSAEWTGTWLQFSIALLGNAYQDYVYALDAGLTLTASEEAAAADGSDDSGDDADTGSEGSDTSDSGNGSDSTDTTGSSSDSDNANDADAAGDSEDTDDSGSTASGTAQDTQTGDLPGLLVWLAALWTAAVLLILLFAFRRKQAD